MKNRVFPIILQQEPPCKHQADAIYPAGTQAVATYRHVRYAIVQCKWGEKNPKPLINYNTNTFNTSTKKINYRISPKQLVIIVKEQGNV